MDMQTHALADPTVEERVAMAAATTAYECPICYFNAREAMVYGGHAAPGKPWPQRMRWEAKVERPCKGCGRLTYWCSAGPWEIERKS